MNQTERNLLSRVEAWPEEDQAELLEMVRAIEARRTGVYELSDDEQAAIEAGRRSGFASDEKVQAFWKRFANIADSPLRARKTTDPIEI